MGSCNSTVKNASESTRRSTPARSTQDAGVQVNYSKIIKNSKSESDMKYSYPGCQSTLKKHLQRSGEAGVSQLDSKSDDKETPKYHLYRAFIKKRPQSLSSDISSKYQQASDDQIKISRLGSLGKPVFDSKPRTRTAILPSIAEERVRRPHQRLPSSGSVLNKSSLVNFYQDISEIDKLYSDPTKFKRSASASKVQCHKKPFIKKLVFCGGSNETNELEEGSPQTESKLVPGKDLYTPAALAKMSPRRGLFAGKQNVSSSAESKSSPRRFVHRGGSKDNLLSLEKSLRSLEDNSSPSISCIRSPHTFKITQKRVKSLKTRDTRFPIVIQSKDKKEKNETDLEKFKKGVHINSRLPKKPMAALFINDKFVGAKY